MAVGGKFRRPSFLDTSSFRMVIPKNQVPECSSDSDLRGWVLLPPRPAQVGEQSVSWGSQAVPRDS